MTIKQAAAAALKAQANGNQAEANNILDTASHVKDYDSRSYTYRMSRLYHFGWYVKGADWEWIPNSSLD